MRPRWALRFPSNEESLDALRCPRNANLLICELLAENTDRKQRLLYRFHVCLLVLNIFITFYWKRMFSGIEHFRNNKFGQLFTFHFRQQLHDRPWRRGREDEGEKRGSLGEIETTKGKKFQFLGSHFS